MEDKNLLYKLGMEENIEKLEEKDTVIFDGQEKLKEQLMKEVGEGTVMYRKPAKRKRLVLIAAIVALLAVSTTALAAVKHFIYDEKVEGDGGYKLDIHDNGEGASAANTMKYVDIKAEYIPQGYVSNEDESGQKLSLHKANDEKYGRSSISIAGNAIEEGSITMAGIISSEDIMLGDIPGKVLTTFSEDGSKGYNVLAFYEEQGYMVTVYGMHSELSLEEMKKVAAHVTGEVKEKALTPEEAEKYKSNTAEEIVSVDIKDENIINIGDMVHDQAAQDAQLMEQLGEELSDEEIAEFKVMYSVDSVKVSETLPDVDLTRGYVSDMLEDKMNKDNTLKPAKSSYAKVNSKTGEVEVFTESSEQKYVKINVTLYNDTDTEVNNYYYQAFLTTLKPDESGKWMKDNSAPVIEPAYLSFQDYSGKSGYKMNLKPGEKRTITALYTVDAKSIDSYYLMFNSQGYTDGSEKCWDNYIKIQ